MTRQKSRTESLNVKKEKTHRFVGKNPVQTVEKLEKICYNDGNIKKALLRRLVDFFLRWNSIVLRAVA